MDTGDNGENTCAKCCGITVFRLKLGKMWWYCCVPAETWQNVVVLLCSDLNLAKCGGITVFRLKLGKMWWYYCVPAETWQNVVVLLCSG
jgi:hypothetical protein